MPAPRLAVAAALLALAPAAASADIITSNTTGTGVSGGTDFSVGQSVTTGAGGPWSHITFNYFSGTPSSPTPYASGALFLLSQSFAALDGTFSTATPGYIASTSTITGGAWDFDDAVTLQPNTQYFLYMSNGTIASNLLLSTTSVYAGGIAYQASASSNDLYIAIPSVDLRFSLNGNPVADTPEPAAALLLAPALLALLRARRRPATSASSSRTT